MSPAQPTIAPAAPDEMGNRLMQSLDARSCGLCAHFNQRLPTLTDSSEEDSLAIMAIVSSGTCSIDDEEVEYADQGCTFHQPAFEVIPA